MQHSPLWRIIFSGGALLSASAAASKVLGILRDRLLLQIYGDEIVDVIFTSFRIPDFFFALLISGTIASIMIPRISPLDKTEKPIYARSFLWLVVLLFGSVCAVMALLASLLVPVFGSGFSVELQQSMVPLVRLLFGSVFLLSASSTLGAYVQSRHHFLSLALAPILYTGFICAGLYFFRDAFALYSVGLYAIVGAFSHMLVNLIAYSIYGGSLRFSLFLPVKSWQGFWPDAIARITSASAVQINYTLDIIIAGLLAAGSVTATTLGMNTGHVLLSILGYPAARYVFPLLSDHKHHYKTQWRLVKKTLTVLLLLSTIPSIIAFLFAPYLISLVFDSLTGKTLINTIIIFRFVVATLPLACCIPVLSRWFLANDDTISPLKISALSLGVGAALTAVLCLLVLPSPIAVVGVGVGTALANILAFTLQSLLLHQKYMKI